MSTNLTMIGRLTKDVEQKKTRKGKSYALLHLAVQRLYKDDNGQYISDFFVIPLWGDKAKSIPNHINKGDLIAVYGQVESNKGTRDNQDKNYINIVASRVEFLAKANRNKVSSSEEIDKTDDHEERSPAQNEIPNDFVPYDREHNLWNS